MFAFQDRTHLENCLKKKKKTETSEVKNNFRLFFAKELKKKKR